MKTKRRNRFDDAYAQEEIEWYGLKEYNKNGVKVFSVNMKGRADEFFNKRFWIGEITIPMFTVDKQLWMSLSPMEIQSAALAIDNAWGYVGTGGLGMGYFALKCAEKDNVHEVKVWEISRNVIDFFNESFKDRKGFEKIKVIEGDVREMEDQQFSFFYMDIYSSMLGDIVLEDMDNFWKNGNDAGQYHFWGQEKVLLQAVLNEMGIHIEDKESDYFQEFFASYFPFKDGDKEKMSKTRLYDEFRDEKFIKKTLCDYLGRMTHGCD